ncbi:UDP-glycosyltransferase UGT5-like [Chironomus tepperi]|uniref:UDP-glycosyltransferase UGT5-like n=1 Tax=Chironomus tepperi TaxID=113505 RepID=UPI00391FA710
MFLRGFLVLFIAATVAECANILAIYPTPSVSHQIVFQRITKDLLDRGHKLTVLTPNPLNLNNVNLTEIDLSSSYPNFQKRFGYGMVKDYRDNIRGFMRTAFEIFVELLNEQLSHPEVKKLINEKENYKFDIMMMEHTGHFPYLALAEIYNIPVIGITSFEAANFGYQFFGSGSNIITNVEQMFPYVANEMTFSQRWECVQATISMAIAMMTPPFPFLGYSKVMQEHFPHVEKGIFELMDKVELLMVNAHPAMGFVRPLVPNTVQLGFMHIEPPKPLEDGPLKKFLDESENGVVYVSFGTNIKSKDLDQELLDILINVFKNLKQNVLWKFEDDKLPNKPDNVMIQKWLPQADVLAHPNVKAFITQCGQQSTEEAVDRTVPMVLMPFFADQPGIAAKLQQKGVGRYVDIGNLNEKDLKEAIEEVLKPEYKENAIKLRELVYDQPLSSRDKAIWWIEHFIRHNGTNHQAYPGRLVPFYKKYCLDFIAIAVLLWHLFIKLVKFSVKEFRNSFKTKIE